MDKLLVLILTFCLLISTAACSKIPFLTAPAGSEPQGQQTVLIEETKPQEPETTEAEPEETLEPQLDFTGWPDVVELVNSKGETTTAYLLADGRYMDRIDRVFNYDGLDTWMCGDEEWNRSPDVPCFTWERAVDRFLAQRPDIPVYQDSDSEFAEKYVFWIQEEITDFQYQALTMDVSEKGELTCVETQTLFSVEKLSPDDGVAISFCCDGVLPNCGIQYTDADGYIHVFYLSISGENGDLLVIPYACG